MVVRLTESDIIRIVEKILLMEEKKLFPTTPKELFRQLPVELRQILVKQWGAKQNPEHHPEGNTLKHILVTIKRAYYHYPEDPNMILTALFHDLGKMDTYNINPKTGNPTAYGHEDKSELFVDKFSDWIDGYVDTNVDEVKFLVKNHMKVKPRTWDSMRKTKKEPIIGNPSFDKLMKFTNKIDGGGLKINNER